MVISVQVISMRRASEHRLKLAFLRGFRSELPRKWCLPYERPVLNAYVKQVLRASEVKPTLAKAYANGKAMGQKLLTYVGEETLRQLTTIGATNIDTLDTLRD